MFGIYVRRIAARASFNSINTLKQNAVYHAVNRVVHDAFLIEITAHLHGLNRWICKIVA